MYLRFGEIPEGEQSDIHFRGEPVAKEEGVSVYHAKVDDDGTVNVCLPLPMTEDKLDTFISLVKYEDRKCYLVEGDFVGRGSDNEPLIKNVKILKEVTYRDKL